jgi:HAMP domain-containing protein
MPEQENHVTTSYPQTKIRFGHSILFKQLVLYLLLILVISATIGYFFFATARVSLQAEIGKKLQYIARISAGDVPFDRLYLIEEGDDETRMVLRIKEKLGQIQQATGVLNIYVFRPDMRSLVDLDPGKRIGTSYKLEHLTPQMVSRMEKGESVHTSYTTAQTAFLISAYSPLFDLDGRLFAVIGVDGGQELAVIQRRMSTRFYWIAGVGGALAAALALVFARSITRPIRQIAQTAEHLGQGDYTARAKIESRDEVGVLAESINRMAEQVRQRDTALKEMGASADERPFVYL